MECNITLGSTLIRIPMVVLCLLHMGPLTAADLPEPITRHLRKSAKQFHHLTVEFRWHRTTTLPDDRIQTLIGTTPGRPEFFGERRATFSRRGEMIYSFMSEMIQRTYADGTIEVSPDEHERTFDGTKMFDGTGTTSKIDNNAMLHIYHAEEWANASPTRRFADSTYFLNAGYRIPATNGEVLTRVVPKTLLLYLLENRLADLVSVQSEEDDGISHTVCLVRDGDLQIKFLLDGSRGYATREIVELTSEGTILQRTVNSDFRRVGNGPLWLPWVSRTAHFTRLVSKEVIHSSPLFYDEVSVVRVHQEPLPTATFALHYPPGTWVTDETYSGGRVTYQMPANAAQLDNVIAEAIKSRELRTRQRTRSAFRIALVIGNVAMVVVLLVSYIRRRKKAA